jgi:hypothetical protein
MANSGGPGDPVDPGSWNRYSYVQADPINFFDSVGLYLQGPGQKEPGATSIAGMGGGRTGEPDDNIDPDEETKTKTLFDVAKTALSQYAGNLAKRLRNDQVSADCAEDIFKLGITPDQWADALEKVDILNGIGSTVLAWTTMSPQDPGYQTAKDRNITIGNQFGPNQNAWGSAVDNRVWINPNTVNPGTFSSAGLIAHETLHNLGLLDPDIQGKLGLTVQPGTRNISDKLGKDCFDREPGWP